MVLEGSSREVLEWPYAIGGGGSPPQVQSDHRAKERNLQEGKSGWAICGTHTLGSQTPPPLPNTALRSSRPKNDRNQVRSTDLRFKRLNRFGMFREGYSKSEWRTNAGGGGGGLAVVDYVRSPTPERGGSAQFLLSRRFRWGSRTA